ncbi:hypothetical protein BDY24DRAFT_417745 [Mrakia frigida]|uniref:uncharacterized protein n=1 Tax=Mrakia frigida TaxID=29902 RepID=UPI003FCC1B8B
MESSETLPSSSRSLDPVLTYRLATWDDEEELRKMRIACGWGEESVKGRLRRCELGIEFLCLFFLGLDPVGMASIETIDSGGNDRTLCDLKTGRVMISSLYIYSDFQGRNLGNRIMGLLELECSYLGLRTCTVHTMPFEEDGKTETKTVKWNMGFDME